MAMNFTFPDLFQLESLISNFSLYPSDVNKTVITRIAETRPTHQLFEMEN